MTVELVRAAGQVRVWGDQYDRTDGDVLAIQEAHSRATALEPRNAEAHHALGYVLAQLGRDSDAEAAYRRAIDIEPGRPITLEHLARLEVNHRRYREAQVFLDSALAVDPGFFSLTCSARRCAACWATARGQGGTGNRRREWRRAPKRGAWPLWLSPRRTWRRAGARRHCGASTP